MTNPRDEIQVRNDAHSAHLGCEEERIDKGLSFCRKMYHCVDGETTLITLHHILLSMINSQTQEIMANKKSSQPSSLNYNI